MHPTSHSVRASRARGVTLVELVVAIVLVAALAGAAVYFLLPLRQAIDVTVRAELTDTADNALQRIGRELRLALPNSVRVDGTFTHVEFLVVHAAGRYRVEGYGAGAPTGTPCDGAGAPDSDRLLFGAADNCFKTIGTMSATVTNAHRLVLNNYGPGFPGQNAYESGATQNWRPLSATAVVNTHDRVRFTTPGGVNAALDPALHDSPGRRYYVISGPVTYSCAAGMLRRHDGYTIQAAQPTLPLDAGTLGAGSLLAANVSRCVFEYQGNVAPSVGLLTLRLALTKARSGGGSETIELVHAIHVRNVP